MQRPRLRAATAASAPSTSLTPIQFTSYVYNQYRRSINGGASFTTYNISATQGSFINPFDYDSRNGVLYGAYTTDTCLAWTNAGTTAPLAAAITITSRLGTGSGE